jgi:hypothetical protein
MTMRHRQHRAARRNAITKVRLEARYQAKLLRIGQQKLADQVAVSLLRPCEQCRFFTHPCIPLAYEECSRQCAPTPTGCEFFTPRRP